MIKEFVNDSPLSPDTTLLILGAGFSGQQIALLGQSLGIKVLRTRRSIEKEGTDLVFDSESKTLPSKDVLLSVTHLISCIPPDPSGKDPVLSSMGEELKQMPIKWAGYLSTTGVYGNCNGRWVSELDTPNPQQLRSKRRLDCEIAWQRSGLPAQILRLPGIYGPGRSALEMLKKGKAKMIDKPNQVFSRIHVDDIASATFHLIKLAANGFKPDVVNIADDLPTSNLEVVSYGASLLNIPVPPIESFEIASNSMSEMALSFWEENRRVSNKMLKENIGYSLIHPDYKSGLRSCLSKSHQNL